MSLKKTTISDLDKFIEESEKARKMPLSQEDIDEINEIAREAELEEQENETDLPYVAKGSGEDQSSIQI